MADEILQSKLELDIKNYIAGLSKAEKGLDDFSKEEKKVEKDSKTSWEMMALGINSVLEIGKKVFNVFSGLVNKMIEMRSAASDQANALNAVNLQLRNTGKYSREVYDELIAQSKAFEDLTNFTDNEILSFQKLMLTFTNVGIPIFEEVTSLALDMSVVFGQDLTSTAIQLGKALNNPLEGLGALSRVGVSFTEQQKKMIEGFMTINDVASAQKVILAELKTEFGGQAALVRDEVDKLNKSFKTLSETLGSIVKPSMDAVALSTASVVDRISNMLQAINVLNKAAKGEVEELAKYEIKYAIADTLKKIEKYQNILNNTSDPAVIADYKKRVEIANEELSKLYEELRTRERQRKIDEIKNTQSEAIKAFNEQLELEKEKNKKIEEERIKEEKLKQEAQIESFKNEVALKKQEIAAQESLDKQLKEKQKKAREEALASEEAAAKERERLKKQEIEAQESLDKQLKEKQRKAREEAAEEEKKAAEAIARKKEINQKIADREYAERLQNDISQREKEEKRVAEVKENIEDLNEEMAKSYEDVKDVATQAIVDMLLGEQKSLGEYINILAEKLSQRLAMVAAESTVMALWETAQGVGTLAATFGATDGGHFAAATTYAKTATAAGLGAIAANGTANATAKEQEQSTTITNNETQNITNVKNQEILQSNNVVISENDYKRYVRDTQLPAIQKALDSGATLRIQRGGK